MEELGVEDFYIVLPSNANPGTHPNNAANKYTVAWETPILFGNAHDWRVALMEMSYNYCPQSVTSGFGIEFTESTVFTLDKIVEIHRMNGLDPYISNTDRRHEVNPSLESVRKELLDLSASWPTCSIDSHDRLVMTSQYQFAIQFTTTADAKIAGFEKLMNVSTPLDHTSGLFSLTANNPFNKREKDGDEKAKGAGDEVDIYNVKLTQRSNKVDVKKSGYFDKAMLWQNIDQLLASIKETFSNVFAKIEVDSSSNGRIKFELNKEITSVRFLNGLNFVLGFSRTKLTNATEVADFPPQLNRGLTHMYVYASICAPIQVGHMRVPLLKSIWLDLAKSYSHDEVRNVDIRHPMYLPINSANMNSIEINIRTDSGALVPFTDGSVTSITLHFKKIRGR